MGAIDHGMGYHYDISITYLNPDRIVLPNKTGSEKESDMVPAIVAPGVIPPFIGGDPTFSGNMSPYIATLDEVAQSLGTSKRRGEILKGLVEFRRELRAAGINTGVQWLDGSFVEQRGVEPNDVDVVTFYGLDPAVEYAILKANQSLFRSDQTKANYLVDGYFVNWASGTPKQVIKRITFWNGLFSHQRNTERWKGMVQVDIESPDNDQAVLDLMRSRGHIT